MSSLNRFVEAVTNAVLSPVIKLLFVLAVMYFFWGVFSFIMNSSNETEREIGKQHMIWGIVGMFIMASVTGIIAIIGGTFGI